MPENDLHILKWLLTTNPETEPGSFESVVHWKRQHETALLAWTDPADMAIAGGFLAPCPAYAFAAGYWAALYRLLPDLAQTEVPALCVSEKHGAHPAKIKCRLEKTAGGWRINGKKHFVTCGREATLLIVAGSTETGPDGKNQLRMVRVSKNQGGITVKPLEKPLSILPEISHGVVEFCDVPILAENVLPGDGYGVYIKPFRTIEDLHVITANLGFLLRLGTLFQWPSAVKEDLIALLVATSTLARADYTAPEIHIAAAGIINALQSLLETIETCWPQVDAAIRSAWHRDRAVLDIAAGARAKRLAAAWRRFA